MITMIKHLQYFTVSMILGFVFLSDFASAQSSVIDTKHNLSVSGPGEVRAMTEERVCIFCHTPHNARDAAPLWNRRDSTAAYIPYDSPTLNASPGQPTGASKLCLSCHDGTVAMGDLLSEDMPVQMMGGVTIPPGGGLIGTDLRDDHPISFPYTDSLTGDGDYAPPGSWDPRVSLDDAGMLQCTSCHDPHDDTWGEFLVMSNTEASLCRTCHTPFGFESTPHATSAATWNGTGLDPWPQTEFDDVRTNACMNCHVSHHAGTFESLLTYTPEENVCFSCHDGSVAAEDMRQLFQKPFRHSVDLATGVHEAGESPSAAATHVECVDCHNPHRARDAVAEPPYVMGALEGASGVNALGTPVDEVVFEYEVCFKCHAQDGFVSLNAIRRQIDTTNVLKEFSTASPSYHPVEAAGQGGVVQSLIPPLNSASIIYCSDCHGSDEEGAGLGAVEGPHGSTHQYMLVREYRTGDNVPESLNSYALCYGCHSRTSILANESFSEHSLHIVNEMTSCSVCHDGHGIDFGQGNTVNNAYLMNFDLDVVEPDPVTGRLEYESNGPGVGACYLTCHGKAHSPLSYP